MGQRHILVLKGGASHHGDKLQRHYGSGQVGQLLIGGCSRLLSGKYTERDFS